jgi:Uma2 family endonuclease
MGLAVKKNERKFNYHDYCKWPENERWELIDGVAYDMSPAPSRCHQEVSGEIFRQIANFLIDKTCKVYDAPFDVRLPEKNEKDEDIETVVQPDIIIVCDKNKLDEKGCKGAPDWLIEVTSPYTAAKDMKEKFFIYEKNKVKEYWIVDPLNEIVMVYNLDKDHKYERSRNYSVGDKIKSNIINGLNIDLALVFKGKT